MRCAHASAASKSASRVVEGALRYVKTATLGSGAAPSPGESMSRGGGARDKKAGPTERFGLLVDGEYYGPFAHVQLTPCVPPGQLEELALPVNTFFPLECD